MSNSPREQFEAEKLGTHLYDSSNIHEKITASQTGPQGPLSDLSDRLNQLKAENREEVLKKQMTTLNIIQPPKVAKSWVGFFFRKPEEPRQAPAIKIGSHRDSKPK